MRKVLVVAYYFPPMGLSGVQRTLKFVKYLPQFEWMPTVLTVSTRGYFAKDETLLKELEPLGIEVVRTRSLDVNRIFRKQEVVKMPPERLRKILGRFSDAFFIPDNKIGWKHPALKAASVLMRKEKFDAVFVTAPPQTDFLIGKALKKKYRLPLVLDYRDAWVDYPFRFYPTPLHRFMHKTMEKHVLQKADAIIVANRRLKELILRRYKFLQYNDIQIISQGFDPEDMKISAQEKLPRIEKMRITFSGVFYENRTPLYFLEALHRVFKHHPKVRGRIEACFIGAFRAEHRKIVRRLELDDAVNILGYLEHKECVRYLLASDVLWMMMDDTRSSPGKIYEYIGAQKKILGCVPEGFMRSLIEEAGGVCVDPTDVEQIAAALLQLYDQYERRKLSGARPDVVDKYNRVMLTGEVAKVLTNLIAE
ncbi:MAG: glycosyltransferase family 4 protein [Bacteroidota bacterium]|nr:glycosyltransferase family 4 protein [Bacteroidota bacterium]